MPFDTPAEPPSFSLADLEAHDPRSPFRGRERRFACPECGSGGRHFCLNMETGLYLCQRCGAKGKLRDYWQERPAPHRRGVSAARRAFHLSPRPHPQSAQASAATPAAPVEKPKALRLFDSWPLVAGTPGAEYLAGRGIPADLAAAAGVRYCERWEHWEKDGAAWCLVRTSRRVVYPIRDKAGELVAVHARAIDADPDPKLTRGPRNAGAFATPGALTAPFLAFCEGPADALSLAAAGVPALAVIGTNLPDWLPRALAFRGVALATDADAAGDHSAATIGPALQSFGCKVWRWRPARKDWNEVLLAVGTVELAVGLAERTPPPPAELPSVHAPAEVAASEDREPERYTRCRVCSGFLQGSRERVGLCLKCEDPF